MTRKWGVSVDSVDSHVVAARNTFLIDPEDVIRKFYTKVNPQPHSAGSVGGP
jgi:peroxiredoxin